VDGNRGVSFELERNFSGALAGALGRSWRDEIPIAFDVGSTSHLWLALRRDATVGTTTLSQTQLYGCHDGVGTCLGDTTINGWSKTTFEPPVNPVTGHQYQPQVAAREGTPYVAVTYYSNLSTNDADPLISFFGAFSVDDGASFSPPFDLLFPQPPQAPCPDAVSSTGKCAGGPRGSYFGDYTATSILPYTLRTIGAVRFPLIVSAHADSRAGCVAVDQLTFDQHVQTEIW
jgi:hypothetical protein